MKSAPLRALLLPTLSAWVACASPEAARDTALGRPEMPSVGADVVHADATATLDGAPVEAVRSPPPAPTPPAETPPATLAELAPWFGDAHFADALSTFSAAHVAAESPVDAVAAEAALAEASKVFADFAARLPQDTRALPARFMAAWIDAERNLGRDEAAAVAGRLEALAKEWPLMADACLLRAARLRVVAGDAARADALLAELGTRAGSIHAGLALDLQTSLLVQDGKTDAARALLEAARDNAPDALEPTSWQRLVELLPAGPTQDEARFELARRHPGHALGKAAFEAIDRQRLAAADKLVLGRALFESGRYDAMRAVLAGFLKKGPEACEAWVLLGRAVERGNRKKDDAALTEKAFDYYEKALGCEGPARAEATFLGGRNRLGKGDTKRGRKLLEAHTHEFPERSTADDARLLLATDSGKKDKKPATRALISALKRYPEGDMADGIAWELVGPHVEKRRWKQVLASCEQVLAVSPEDVPGRHAGRYRYWRARALWELGKHDEARAEWRVVFAKNPLSWYAVLAYSRLVADDPATGRALLAEVQGAAPAEPLITPSAWKNLWQDEHFRRAVEWARLAGAAYDKPSPLLAWVEAELDAVAPGARPAGEVWSWARVEVDQLAGAFARSMRRARTAESAAQLPFPVGELATAWKLAYPRPFPDLVTHWASERGLRPHWIWAVMRVESNFDPTAVSWANAVGLMQIILPTAKTLVRDTQHEPTRDNLMRPEVAVELGTKYLAKLLDRHKVYPLASAGYNAGGGAVSKWRKQFGEVELDEFVERIPYREAHLYAKSVTQTLARYVWLYEGELLALDLLPVGAPTAAQAPTE